MKGKKGVYGGIQRRIVRLILVELVVILTVIMGILWYYSSTRDSMEEQVSVRERQSISEVSSGMMELMIMESLQHANMETMYIADTLFGNIQNQVEFLAARAERLFAHPENYVSIGYSGQTNDQGAAQQWDTQLVFVQGTDPSDPEMARLAGLLGNLSESMSSLCTAFSTQDIYIALPEGIFLSVKTWGEDWLSSYDPRERIWYQQAAEAGKLIFTEGEVDARTGVFCVECAMPVYGPDGSLRAVVGADLYLDEMQEVMANSVSDGEYHLLVSRNGRAMISEQEQVFPMKEEDRGQDLRQASTELLAQVVEETLREGGTYLQLGTLADGEYYIVGSDIDVTGWALISAYSRTEAELPADVLLEAFRGIEQENEENHRQNIRRFLLTILGMLALVILAALLAAQRIGRSVARPIQTITRRISELGDDDSEFIVEEACRTGDEVETLAEAFADLSRRNIKHVAEVQEAAAEKERIGTELSLATEIQAAMLPHQNPPFPERTEFDILGEMFPAREVGGDFYDYFLIDEDHLGLLIADVSGKGVPAALFMMASRIILQSCARLGRSAAEILSKTNEAVCSDNEAQMFVTVWLGILEISTGRLTCANAGHEYPALRHPDGKFELYKDPHGLVIGGMEGVKYREYELMLEPGAKLFVYTDGVPEATDARKELFGTQRMLDALNDAPQDASPADLMKQVRSSVDAFVKEAEQFDDLTMLCLEYKGGEERKS